MQVLLFPVALFVRRECQKNKLFGIFQEAAEKDIEFQCQHCSSSNNKKWPKIRQNWKFSSYCLGTFWRLENIWTCVCQVFEAFCCGQISVTSIYLQRRNFTSGAEKIMKLSQKQQLGKCRLIETTLLNLQSLRTVEKPLLKSTKTCLN